MPSNFVVFNENETDVNPACRCDPGSNKNIDNNDIFAAALGFGAFTLPDRNDGIHTPVANARDSMTNNKLAKAVRSSLNNEANDSNNSGKYQRPATTTAVPDLGNFEATNEASNSIDGDNCSCRKHDAMSNNVPITLL